MRRASRTDRNQPEIVAALEAIGASVAITSAVGKGFPDLVVGFRMRTWLLELKDGTLPPSRRTLTPDQIEFKARWRGHWAVVKSADEAIEVVTRGA